LPQYSFFNDKLEYFLYYNQTPEESPFGLVFKDNEVAQIGIENFEKVLDYKENFQIKGNYYIWYMFHKNQKNYESHNWKETIFLKVKNY